MNQVPKTLIDLLEVKPAPGDSFEGEKSTESHVRVFGGQLIAQAASAAISSIKTAADGNPPLLHSLHARFLRPASTGSVLNYSVENSRDGRSFTARRVLATQGAKTILHAEASFHQAEDGLSHQEAMPDVASPDELAPFEERFAGRDKTWDMARWFTRARPFDIRYVDHSPFDPPRSDHPAEQSIWIKHTEQVDYTQAIHQIVFAYASDLAILDPILLRHQRRWTDQAVLGASLDHTIWIHRPFRCDEWLLFWESSPVAAGGRGLAIASVWTIEGVRVATIVQEALLRPPAGLDRAN